MAMRANFDGVEPDGVPAIIQELQPEVEILGERALEHPADVIEVARELAIVPWLVQCDIESVGCQGYGLVLAPACTA
jgi:hypothetical protein